MIDDEQSSVADDAVSNRSDDTAIDEGEVQVAGSKNAVTKHMVAAVLGVVAGLSQ